MGGSVLPGVGERFLFYLFFLWVGGWVLLVKVGSAFGGWKNIHLTKLEG